MLLDKSIPTLAQLLKEKKISSVDLLLESFKRIEKIDNTLHSFITVREKKDVLSEAEKKDKARTAESPLLWGIPFSLKDAYVTEGVTSTAGSKVLDAYIPQYNATVYQKLLDEGAILIGKNNMDAWGHGGSTENTDYSPGRNPWDTTRIPGGSGGGSAAAIASRMTSFAISEDTGGSIRNPASFCNVSGLKVTYGRVSRYGAIAYASSLDSVGPTAKSAEDIACVLQYISGNDPMDATSSKRPVAEYGNRLAVSLKNKIIGVPKEFFSEGLHHEVKEAMLAALKVYESLGASIREIHIPYALYGVSIYYLIAMSETSSNLARYDNIRYGNPRELFTPETMRRIMIGTYALSAGYADKLYKKAQKARTVLIHEFEEAFTACDIILAPVTPNKPQKIGELINDPLQNLLEDLYTVTANLVGIPSLALPAGFTKDKLPIGMQLMGPKFSEEKLLQYGHAYQQATNWHTKIPEIAINI